MISVSSFLFPVESQIDVSQGNAEGSVWNRTAKATLESRLLVQKRLVRFHKSLWSEQRLRALRVKEHTT